MIPMDKIPLTLLVANTLNSGWLEWNGTQFYINPVPTGIDEVPENPGGPSGAIEYRTPGAHELIPVDTQKTITAVIVAAGGGGAGGGLFSNPAGGGAQAGEIRVVEINCTPGTPVKIIVGIGGTGGSPQSKGRDGGDSSVGDEKATGGQGGQHSGSPRPIGSKVTVLTPNAPGAKHLFALSLGGGNTVDGPKRVSQDYQFGTCNFNTQSPHKTGGSGGSNQLAQGGNGGNFSPSGTFGSVVSNGFPGSWPGGGGGGGGSDECENGSYGGAGEDGVVWIFWGDEFKKRFPKGLAEISPADRAGLSVGIDLWYKEVA